MSKVPISFEISGVQGGWANMDVRAADVSHRLDGFSYTTYAFDDFVRFGVDIILGAYTAEVIFDGEPAGWSMSFSRSYDPAKGAVVDALRIFEIEDVSDQNAARIEVLAVQVAGHQVGVAVEAAIAKLESEMGIDAFEFAWMQAYPVRGMAALRAALGQPLRPQPEIGL